MAFQQKSPSSPKGSGVLGWISSGLRKGAKKVAELDIGSRNTVPALTRSEQRALGMSALGSSRRAGLEGTPSGPPVAGGGRRPQRVVDISPIEMSRGTPPGMAVGGKAEGAMDEAALDHNAPVHDSFGPELPEVVHEGAGP
jgi:hypothetical protein